jgi:hypothetical protein
MARGHETFQRWRNGARKTSAAHNKDDGFPTLFVGFIAAVGVILVAGISMV